jgi:hypothetical protein
VHVTCELPAQTYVFEVGVSPDDQALVNNELPRVIEQFRGVLGVEVRGFIVYTFSSRDQFRRRYHSSDDCFLGLAGGGAINFSTERGNCGWGDLPTWERTLVVAHEYFHLLQESLAGGSFDRGFANTPFWLTEGAAELGGAWYASVVGLNPYEDYKRLAIERSRRVRELRDCQSRESQSVSCIYYLGLIATDYLTGGDVRKLGALWSALGAGTPFTEVFQTLFGRSLDQFYVDFAAYRQTLGQT